MDLIRCINNLNECEDKEKDSNIKQLVLLKNDIKDMRDQAIIIRQAICILELLAKEHGFLKENNIDMLSPVLDELLEEQLEFQEHIPSTQFIDAITILTSETTFKIHEQMEILEITQYDLKHACYFTDNFKKNILSLVEEKIKQLKRQREEKSIQFAEKEGFKALGGSIHQLKQVKQPFIKAAEDSLLQEEEELLMQEELQMVLKRL